MKVKQHLQIESVITGKPLPKDLEKMDTELWKYYSTSQDKVIDFGDMELFHFARAFKKFLEKQDDNDFAIASADRVHKSMKERLVREQSVNKAKDSIIAGLRSQIDTFREEEHRWRKAYAEEHYTQGHRYVFSEIPNDTEGQEILDNIKKYINKESYTVRVKGQHLKPELYGQGKAYHGATLGDSTHMRVYIDKKKGE